VRKGQKEAEKGSQKWIQLAVNTRKEILGRRISDKLRLPDSAKPIAWVSPLSGKDYAEHHDASFLDELKLHKHAALLDEFWPRGGPHWDALGKTEDGRVFLVEAKANIIEMISSCRASSARSRDLIQKSLDEVKDYLKVPRERDWLTSFYQYANRFAHLYFLRQRCSVDAYLVFIYFTGDYTHIDTSPLEWDGALELVTRITGLGRTRLSPYVADVYVDVRELADDPDERYTTPWEHAKVRNLVSREQYHLFECGRCSQPLVLPEIGNFGNLKAVHELNDHLSSGKCPNCGAGLRRMGSPPGLRD
jgi:hypothetical protein